MSNEIIKCRTENSMYEIDLAAKKIRRLTGMVQPTERQGKDGEWKGYGKLDLIDPIANAFVTEYAPGIHLMILWDGTTKATLTSQVLSVEKVVVDA